MASALTAGRRFSPLDDELALLPGGLTPQLQEWVVRLGTWMPFGPAAAMLADFAQVTVSEATARRLTEAAGTCLEAVQTAEAERIARELPPAPRGADKMVLSADGAMVPLVDGEWAEVKTLALGVVGAPVEEKGEFVVHTQDVSYFSRLADADTFGRRALVETQRRGLETAQQVSAVADGADWIQGFIDLQRPDAVRILDFAHAAERVSAMGQAVYGVDTAEGKQWLTAQLHALKHDGPATVLADLRTLTAAHPDRPSLTEHLAYLAKREGHMQYPTYQAQGWPIGSGIVESGNKLVVEARLKGAGMHWARAHVNPMLALRNGVCNDRWAEAWPQVEAMQRQQRRLRHAPRPQPPSESTVDAATPIRPPLAQSAESPAPPPSPTTESPTVSLLAAPPAPRRPAPNHPWRRMSFGRAMH